MAVALRLLVRRRSRPVLLWSRVLVERLPLPWQVVALLLPVAVELLRVVVLVLLARPVVARRVPGPLVPVAALVLALRVADLRALLLVAVALRTWHRPPGALVKAVLVARIVRRLVVVLVGLLVALTVVPSLLGRIAPAAVTVVLLPPLLGELRAPPRAATAVLPPALLLGLPRVALAAARLLRGLPRLVGARVPRVPVAVHLLPADLLPAVLRVGALA